MKRFMYGLVISFWMLVLGSSFSGSFRVFAQEGQEGTNSEGSATEDFQNEGDAESLGDSAVESMAESSDEMAPAPTKRAKGGSGAKEDAGSKAPNVFEAGIIPKSRYQLNGQPLEVDPD